MPSEDFSDVERALFTTVLIEAKGWEGRWHGTGFLINVEEPHVGIHTFLVTNKHVIRGMQSITIALHRKSLADGSPNLSEPIEVQIDGFEGLFKEHTIPEVDVAVAYLTPILEKTFSNRTYGFHDTFLPEAFKDTDILTPDDYDRLDALEDVVFIGYPSVWWDNKTFLPITRKGCTATPVFHPYEDINQFLIDGAVYPGSSGSPVFISSEYKINLDKSIEIKRSLKLAGVVSAVMLFPKEGEIKAMPCGRGAKMEVHTDEFGHLGVVYGAESIMDVIVEWMDEILENKCE